jgi:hypothetical protein
MKYQLVLQYQNMSFAQIIKIEDLLTERISSGGDVDGHDFGQGEGNIFILTDNPDDTFEEVKKILMTNGDWAGIRVGFREVSENHYTVLWPKNSDRFTVA